LRGSSAPWCRSGRRNELQDLESDPQIRHLDVFYEIEHPRYGKVKAPRRPVRIDGSRDVDFRPPPDLGEHTDECYMRSVSRRSGSRNCGERR